MTETRQTVEIDVQPGDPGNNVQTDGNFSDKMYVAIKGGNGFDATQVAIDSVRFGPADAAPFPTNPYQIADIDSDGFMDMNVRFRIADTGLTCDMVDAEVNIRGALTVSPPEYGFVGADTVTTEACEPASCHP